MVAKKCILLTIFVLTVFLVGCQIPQYNVQQSQDGDEELADELEEIISEIESGEEEEPETMSEEELAREEFQRKLLEKQEAAQEDEEETSDEEVAEDEEDTTEEDDEELTEDEEETADEDEEETVVEEPTETKLTVTVKEGETVELKPKAEDPDGDKLTFTFGKPLNENGVWETEVGDAGTYFVEVSVSDGKVTVTDTVKIIVEALNRAPVLEAIEDITVKEGETVTIEVEATDEDSDKLTYKFSGWMDSSTYTTNYNDAGEHTVTVEVSDGKATVSQEVSVTVEDVNRPPVLTWG